MRYYRVVMKGPRLAGILVAAALAVLGGCYEFNNPVDPEAQSYRSPGEGPPSAPKNLRPVNAGSSTVTIEWDAVDGAEEYLVEYHIESGSFAPLDPPLSPTEDTTISHYPLSAGIHHYRVFARNEHGSSPPSSELAVTLPP